MKKSLLIVALIGSPSAVFGVESLNKQLFSAIATKKPVKTVRQLLYNGASVYAKNELSETPLIAAAKEGSLDICKLLIARWANPDTKDINGWSALAWASVKGYLDICKLLIDKGAHVNTKNKWKTPLLVWAVENNLKDIVTLLIENGARLGIKDAKGTTPLIKAVEKRSIALCKMLLEKGAKNSDKNNEGQTALFKAAEIGNYEACRLLLEWSADCNARDTKGTTPLMIALKGGHEDIAKVLLQRHANVHPQNTYGKTALSYAHESGFAGLAKVISDELATSEKMLTALNSDSQSDLINLLKSGAHANTRVDGNGNTLLSHAVEKEHLDICKALLDGGADIFTKNNEGNSPFSQAIAKGNVELCRLIVSYAEVLPDLEGVEEARKRIKTALLTFKRKTKLSKDVQYLILKSNDELKKDLLTTVIADMKRGSTPPDKLRNLIANAITDSTLQKLRPLIQKELGKNNVSAEIKSLLDTSILEKTFGKSVYENIRYRFGIVPPKAYLKEKKPVEIKKEPKDAQAPVISIKTFLIGAFITYVGYYILQRAQAQEKSSSKGDIIVS